MSWDGKIFDKYRIEHTDGTPLKGKKYFVLRLDSDDPVEAARVAAAMRAYKNEPRNCDIGTAEEQLKRHGEWCTRRPATTHPCLDRGWCRKCFVKWAQMPYESEVVDDATRT